MDNNMTGALWKRTAKSWLIYHSWIIEINGTKYNIAMFDNDKHGIEKRPDFNIKISEMEEKSEEVTVEDIPF